MTRAAEDITPSVDAEIHLLAPGLLGPQPSADPGAHEARADPGTGPRPCALERLLARGDARRAAPVAPGAAGLLLDAFGIADAPGAAAPVAALTWLADAGVPAPDYVLRADPVHLRAQAAGLVLVGPDALGIAPEEARALAAACAPALPPDARLEAPTPTRWYLHLPEDPRLETTPLARALGAPVRGRVVAGAGAAAWNACLNEIQMRLHASAVNAAREASGAPTVNSVWPWGGGAHPAAPPAVAWARVWSADPLARGLAALAGCACAPRPRDAPALLAALDAPGRHLVLLDPLPGDEPRAWRAALGALDRAWFRPLLAALAARALVAVEVAPGEGVAIALGRRAARRWWRRPRPVALAAARLRALARG